MILIKNAEIYTPEFEGKKDVLICGERIECIEDSIQNIPDCCEIINGENKILTPGLIDQHVHITGGGGEGSFHTRTPELELSELIMGG
ncbi:MAG: beta-aspartyl-peptidase, partial [Dorea sp.]